MQTPNELRELAAYHRKVAMNARTEDENWRLKLADYLENLADETEKAAAEAGRSENMGVANTK